MMIRRVIGIVGVVLLVGLVGGMAWLARLLLVVGTEVPPETLTPPVTVSLVSGQPIQTIRPWEEEKPVVRAQFEKELYGTFPKASIAWQEERRVVDDNAYGGKGVIEEIVMTEPSGTLRVPVVLVTPKNATSSPLIITANFCANHNVFPEYSLEKPAIYPSLCDDDNQRSFKAQLKTVILGRYIQTAPVEKLLDHGIAYAAFYTGSFAPDDKEAGPKALEALSQLTEQPVTGVIAAWAWGYTEVMHELEKETRIDANRIALYGHSRDGKAALLAGAFDESVDMVIAHQSGRGGAAPAERKVGESIESIMHEYPYWFDPMYLTYAGREQELPVDQQFLVALMAPRPLLLTGARLDKWADPKGAFMAARDASAIYNLYVPNSFTAEKLTDFTPTDPLAFFMRPLNHGVRESDWEAFIAFMDAHFEAL